MRSFYKFWPKTGDKTTCDKSCARRKTKGKLLTGRSVRSRDFKRETPPFLSWQRFSKQLFIESTQEDYQNHFNALLNKSCIRLAKSCGKLLQILKKKKEKRVTIYRKLQLEKKKNFISIFIYMWDNLREPHNNVESCLFDWSGNDRPKIAIVVREKKKKIFFQQIFPLPFLAVINSHRNFYVT